MLKALSLMDLIQKRHSTKSKEISPKKNKVKTKYIAGFDVLKIW